MANNVGYVAGADIYPCRFIKFKSGSPFTVIQATANSRICGVSQEATTLVPIDGMTDSTSVFAARTGMNVPYYDEHQECLIEVGGAITAGAFVISDANGKAVAASEGNTTIGGVALESATEAGQKIRIRVEFQRSAIPSN